MKLFADLYLDEDVNVLVARLIRARAFTALTTQEAERLGATDEEQLAYASAHDFVILTHNGRDFENLHRQWESQARSHCGIIIAVQRPPYELAQRLLKLLNQLAADEFHNQLFYV